MEFYEVVNKRRSIRQFEDKEIPREILERILDAGLKAPSSNHQRRWELLTLTDKACHSGTGKMHPSLSLPDSGAEIPAAGNVSDRLSPASAA